MEPKTADKILNDKIVEHKCFSTDPYEVFVNVKGAAIASMREYAQQAVRMALEMAAENAKQNDADWEYDHGVDKDSILSLESSIVAKMK